MHVIRDLSTATQIKNTEMRRLVVRRITHLASQEPYDASLHGYFVVLETGDTIEAIQAQIQFDPRTRPWEILEEYPSCWDLLIIVDDSGFGIELLISKTIEIPSLVSMCKRHATPGAF